MWTLIFELYSDWNWEIVDFPKNPTVLQVDYSKWQACTILSLREIQKLSSLKWIDATLFVRNRAIELIQVPWK